MRLFLKYENFRFYYVQAKVKSIKTKIGTQILFIQFKKIIRLKDDLEITEGLNELKKFIESKLDICLKVNYKRKGLN